MKSGYLGLFVLVFFSAAICRAEDPAVEAQAAPQAAAGPRSIAILQSNDTSGLFLGPSLQNAMAQLFTSTQAFNVTIAARDLSGFTPPEISALHQETGAELLAFTYVERERVAVFMFDVAQPERFIVASQTFPPGSTLNATLVETQFREAISTAFQMYSRSEFQPLPGAQERQTAQDDGSDPKARDQKARLLFKELADLQESALYYGGTFGMSRYGVANSSISVVDFGGFVGYRFSPSTRFEGGFSISNYFTLYGDILFAFPIAERYVSTHVGAGVASILGVVSQTRTFNSDLVKPGSALFGPSIGFDVPLMGAFLRGELKAYFGPAMVITNNYAIAFSF